MKKKKLIISGIIVVVLLAISVPFLTGNSAAKSMKLDLGQASRSTIANSVTATGTVEPVVKVEVGTQVSGIIDRIYVDYNSVVTKGQLIAEMDKINLQAELVSKEAELASSKTEYEYQEKNYARSKALYEKQLISDTEYETATYNYEKAKSSYDRLRSDMVRVRRNLEYATITSPIDGVVINRAVEEGQTVAAGFSTPTLFTIANDLTQMRVIADVDEADIGQVADGQRVTFSVDAYPDDVFEGNVTQIRLEATVTSNVVTYEVVISAYNPELKLKPGLTANVVIYTDERPNVLTIPSKALRFIPDEKALESLNLTVENVGKEAPVGKKIVWQRVGQTVQPKVITTGTSTLNMVEVLDGLKDGEEVIVDLASVGPVAGPPSGGLFSPGPPGGNRNNNRGGEESAN
ncbi:efflux RND transporter periplasmic adaptor subunit [Parabacteroides sp. PF5-9]|uniref:efflux RND transporter periplasmic adaptor subunit n=1 Tax=Parabacteroides sp. PF5-9 TaxID=1742404 RepID=UPI0024760453|nr:efflux RND transporter periplasmic adaptor subunit [Parabacteroides sp. PF5-9]MDH6356393.1 HlyD family secretion protein [Parabacteroides sp. PF5-9]